MVVSRFSAYDLIVDIVPGFVFLILLYPVIPESLLQNLPLSGNQAFQGVILVIGAYPAGRLLHGIGSIIGEIALTIRYLMVLLLSSMARRFSSSGFEPFDKLARGADYLSFLLDTSGIQSQKTYAIQYLSIDKANSQALLRKIHLDEHVLGEVMELMEATYGVSMSNKEDADAWVHYAYNILYPEENLYRKYEILHTFFKNTTFLLIIVGSVYVISNQPVMPYIGLGFLILAIFSYYRQTHWRRSKHRALFNDLHSMLKSE